MGDIIQRFFHKYQETPETLPDGGVIQSQCDKQGRQLVASQDFLTQVGLGNVEGWSYVEKFGENPDVNTATDPEDVWGFGGLYNFSTDADIDTVSSSNAGDTQDIVIIGQTADYTEVTQTVTLDGQNKVTLGTPLRRFYRAYNDGATDLAGTVYIYVNGDITDGVPDTDADVRGLVVNGDNQTEMAIYTIPKGKQGFFLGGYVAISRGLTTSAADFTWRLRLPGKTFRVQSRIACVSTGRSSWDYKYPIPVGPLPEGTDILLRVESVTANNTGCAGGFTILLQDV